MPWVKAEYAGELAVVAAWIAALVPWSLSLQPNGPFGSVLFMVRWPFASLQVRIPAQLTANGEALPVEEALTQVYPGINVFGSFYVSEPISAATFYEASPLVPGGYAWLAGAAIVLVALGLSVALYLDEAATAPRLPADHVRVMALLLGLATVAFAVASFYYYLGRDVVGVPVPVGVAIVGALAIVLARVERV